MNKMYQVFTFAVFLIGTYSWSEGRKTTDVDANTIGLIKPLIREKFVEKLPRVPATVRLAFHDCVGDRCDGCLNFKTHNENKGLEDLVFKVLEPLYQGNVQRILNKRGHTLSRADFWQLAANVGLEMGMKNARKKGSGVDMKNLPKFMVGRTDCKTSPTTTENHKFPSPKMNRKEMFKYYKDHFGFNKREVTALMGAHTLGGANKQKSGHDGVWTPGEEIVFDNKFYQLIVNNSMRYNNTDVGSPGTPRFQFNFQEKSGKGFMLNTDMEIAYNIDVDPNTGAAKCKINTASFDHARSGNKKCPRVRGPKQGWVLAYQYSKNNNMWLQDFKGVYEKMISHGYHRGQLDNIDNHDVVFAGP